MLSDHASSIRRVWALDLRAKGPDMILKGKVRGPNDYCYGFLYYQLIPMTTASATSMTIAMLLLRLFVVSFDSHDFCYDHDYCLTSTGGGAMSICSSS